MSQEFSAPKRVAAVVTGWRPNSHADVLLSRLLEPEAWGHERPFALKLAVVYADRFPEDDLCRAGLLPQARCSRLPDDRRHSRVGTRGVPVEGVLIIGEHGNYAENAKGQKLYSRRRLVEGVVNAFRALGRRVPVFSDKHLSYDWRFARWMYDLSRHEGFPIMAGSSLPVAWRVPALAPPIGMDRAEAEGVRPVPCRKAMERCLARAQPTGSATWRGSPLRCRRGGARSPSPPGRRCPAGADEGLGPSIDLPPVDLAPEGTGAPHPAVPATFSRGEKGGSRLPLWMAVGNARANRARSARGKSRSIRRRISRQVGMRCASIYSQALVE